ncbi:hypothetical protein [Shewanella psychrotolerans]|uniref:hypothetical protein n=1 Tax=Shewanella psychrotolerans TaxID=2864206 RepID=UPI003313A1DD
MAISLGHLYHFKNKEDIIHFTFSLYESLLRVFMIFKAHATSTSIATFNRLEERDQMLAQPQSCQTSSLSVQLE